MNTTVYGKAVQVSTKARAFITRSAAATRALGGALARALPSGSVLLLSGALGSGKTTFIQGIARGLGVRGRVTSPSFILCAVYPAPRKQWFCHVDLYRLKRAQAVPWETLRDYLGAPDSITAIEWPERLGRRTPKQAIRIVCSHAGRARRIRITASPSILRTLSRNRR